MSGAHEEEFRRQGYSEESLKMLKSDEGQLNAVYACFGSAMAQSQLCKLFRALKPAQILEMRDLAPQAFGTPHRMPEKRQNRPELVGKWPPIHAGFPAPVG